MRVVAGEFRGRRLAAPVGSATRPTTDQVREAVFNSLGSLGVLEGAVVLDLYAGSGALGIEALSRGAEHVTFVERDSAALRAIGSNLATLDLTRRATVVPMDVDRWRAIGSARAGGFDLVFADPPYDFTGWDALMGDLSAGLVIAESGRQIGELAGWSLLRTRRYGRAHVTFYEPCGDTVDAP